MIQLRIFVFLHPVRPVMKTSTFLLILGIFLSLGVVAQDQKPKTDYGLQLGTMFTTSTGYGSGLVSYIAPHMGYNVSSRLKINAGISIINTNLMGYQPYYSVLNSEQQKTSGNLTSALVWLNGQYMLNSRLTLSGTVYKQFSVFDNLPGNSPYKSLNDFQGVNFGFSYKATDHFTIDGSIGITKGYSPFNYYTDPLYSDPFRSTFPGIAH
jgi:hypothetical protein